SRSRSPSRGSRGARRLALFALSLCHVMTGCYQSTRIASCPACADDASAPDVPAHDAGNRRDAGPPGDSEPLADAGAPGDADTPSDAGTPPIQCAGPGARFATHVVDHAFG